MSLRLVREVRGRGRLTVVGWVVRVARERIVILLLLAIVVAMIMAVAIAMVVAVAIAIAAAIRVARLVFRPPIMFGRGGEVPSVICLCS